MLIGKNIYGNSNPCHTPGGSSKGGQFCDEKGGSSGGGSSAKSGSGDKGSGSSSSGQSTSTVKLSKSQENALTKYSGSAHQTINSGLRSGKLSASDKKTVAELDSAMKASDKKMELIGNPKLYRAADIPEIKNALKQNKNLVGVEFTDKGFVSTTKSLDVAKSFQRGDSQILIVSAPKGTKMIDMAKHSEFGDKEQEVLLSRGLKFKVTKVEKVKDKQQYRDFSGKVKTRTVTVDHIHVEVDTSVTANLS